jgi:hypothetical protein
MGTASAKRELTDAEREFSYDRQHVPSGQLNKGLDEAPRCGWVLADMKRDWRGEHQPLPVGSPASTTIGVPPVLVINDAEVPVGGLREKLSNIDRGFVRLPGVRPCGLTPVQRRR